MKPSRREVLAGGAVLPFVWPASSPQESLYPDDAFSRPLEDRRPVFETLDRVAPFLQVDDRDRHFSEQSFRLEETSGQPFARWRFCSRGLPHNVLYIHEWIRRAPRSVSLRIANRSDRAIVLEMQAHELTWLPARENTAAQWVLGPRQMLAAGEERVVVFPFAEARSDKRDRIRYPMVALQLLVGDIEKDRAYTIDLAELTVHYEPAPNVRVERITASSQAGAARFGVVLTRPASLDAPVDLEVRRAGRVLWRIRLRDSEAEALGAGRCEVEREVPWWLPPGILEAGLVVAGYRAAAQDAQAAAPREASARLRTAPRRMADLPRVERRLRNGRPSVFVDGRPFCWRGYASYDYQPGNVGEFATSSANVFCIPVSAGRHIHHVAEQNWFAADRFDFGEVDERVALTLQANPDAFVCLRASLALPPWWLQQHEEDLVRVHTDRGVLIWEEGAATRAASLASNAWLRDQEAALRALIRHCRSQPWASRILGFWVMCEVTEEWFAWGCNDGYYSDYSEPVRRAFARATGAERIPTPEERKAPGRDIYPDTGAGRLASRYHAFLSDLTANTIGHFARIVKDETKGRSLVGCFYGYVVELAGEPRQALSGQFGLRKVIDDPNVDLLACVPLLDFRDLSNGYNPYSFATESIQRAGKLACSENDMFSWLHPILWHTLYDPADPRAGAIAMHERECANDAVHGTIQQKFSLAASWHHDAALHRAFAHQAGVYGSSQELDRTGAEEIAFVVDDASFAATPPETTYLSAAHKLLLRDLGRTGAPVGVWLLSDLDKLPRRIRFVVIPASYAARDEDVRKLERLLRDGGKTVWAIGGPGLVEASSGAWRADAPARLLGMPVKVTDSAGSGAVELVKAGRGVPSIAQVRPRFEASGAGWLRYVDGPTAGLERDLPKGGKLIWSGVPVIETRFLRTMVEQAGVHCYAPEGCFVHAARGLVAVTAPVAGDQELRWPFAVRVRDLLDGWAGSGRAFACRFGLGQTRLFAVSRA